MPEVSERVGPFLLVRELGTGGFGAVYLGEDASGRRAAVKLLHPHLAKDPQVRRYFTQELTNARQVQGFCVAEILDADSESAQPWLATEYIDGPTLGQAVREHGPRTGGDLQRLAVQTITALAAIHAAGVVHRDLKPANILLGADGPRVIDFGIARALDADTASATQIGTIGYMAPEQLEGTTLGTSADLFAWGAVIIHAATGHNAFPGPTQAARINRVLNHPPETGDLADPLLGIVLACMAKDPAQRPTARHVLDLLLTGSAPAAGPSPIASTPAVAAPSPVAAALAVAPDGQGGEDAPDPRPQGVPAPPLHPAPWPAAPWPPAVVQGGALAVGRTTGAPGTRLRPLLGILAGTTAVIVLAAGAWFWWPQSERRTLTGHDRPVMSVAFSPKGTTLATASGDGTARLWDTESGAATTTLTGHDEPVRAVAFDPDGTTLATGGADHATRLWNTDSGKEIHALEGHESTVYTVAFSPDGDLLATGGGDTVMLWDPDTGKEAATLTGHGSWVEAVAFSPDGSTLASAGNDKTVKLWDTETGAETTTLTGHSDLVGAVAFSPDGDLLATGSSDNTVKLWDPATGEETTTLKAHGSWVDAVAFSPDGSTLATAGNDDTVKLWDPATGEETTTLATPDDPVTSVAFSSDGSTLATAGRDNTVKLWDVP
ncbi:WD domain G-beta repeat uncharacterized protein [Murinocardiopsis flavida]|uniref:WD domain G-beta repeat uncharacterized protein n=1 Tax=Murinocardiopsis flavida TaxID=645275 RepID=A0A2P8CDK6_9ACTN|nr:serine/threonine-protein kinase [Murinocardiopsis flavida]PSK83067.1 WD domain G-beta repeat uncharacterized protein [Murinocardiopsis flavida]